MNDLNSININRKRRRRRRRLIVIVWFLLLATGLAWFFELQATTTIILSRYADQQSNSIGMGLSPTGQRRSQELARVLSDVDVVAGVDAIFVAPTARSRITATPLALANEVPIYTIEDPSDAEGLVQRILTDFKGKIVLIVTEPEYISPTIIEMHGSKKLPVIDGAEYDNLYIVTIPWFGKVKTLRLRYGNPYLGS